MIKKIIFCSAILTNIVLKAGTTDVVLTSTKLPLIIINTNGVDIPNGNKIKANMKIIYNGTTNLNHPADPGNVYNGSVGIELRGSYSLTFPQKSYAFETRDAQGNSLNVPILNMPSENDWILTASWNDKSFMRFSLAYNLFERMGHYGTRTQLCEVILNNDYQGIYTLTEKIKRDKNRVDISTIDPDDNKGDSLTGGYIIKIDNSSGSDGWSSTIPALDRPDGNPYFIYVYPKPENITAQQTDYIQGFIYKLDSALLSNKFNDPLIGYRTYVNVRSFIDYFIVEEFARNVDAYKKSAFFFKDRDSKGGLLNAGPVWDFDWAFKNIKECLVNDIGGGGWTYEISSVCKSYPVPPGWVNKMLKDKNFANELNTRYFDLRKTLLKEEYIDTYIDSIYSLVKEAQVRHFAKWQTLGINNGTPEVDAQPTTYDGEIDKFRSWIYTRLNWLDENMPGQYIKSDLNTLAAEKTILRLFPNPVNDILYLETDKKILQVEIINTTGSAVKIEKTGGISNSVEIDVRSFQAGLYIVKVTLEDNSIVTSKFIIN